LHQQFAPSTAQNLLADAPTPSLRLPLCINTLKDIAEKNAYVTQERVKDGKPHGVGILFSMKPSELLRQGTPS